MAKKKKPDSEKPTDELDDLLNEINQIPDSFNTFTAQQSQQTTLVPTLSSPEDLNTYIINKGVELIESGLNAVRLSSNASLPEEVEAYGKLIKSVASAVEAVNKINLQAMRNKNSKELRKMDIEARKELPAADNQPRRELLVTTRDDFFRQILGVMEESPKKIIDVTPEETEEVD